MLSFHKETYFSYNVEGNIILRKILQHQLGTLKRIISRIFPKFVKYYIIIMLETGNIVSNFSLSRVEQTSSKTRGSSLCVSNNIFVPGVSLPKSTQPLQKATRGHYIAMEVSWIQSGVGIFPEHGGARGYLKDRGGRKLAHSAEALYCMAPGYLLSSFEGFIERLGGIKLIELLWTEK